jgi:mono/diheme cytochrome c family protein
MSGKSRKIGWTVLLLLALGAIAIWWVKSAGGFSARQQPSKVEAMLARNARLMAIPREARAMSNAMELTPEMLIEARRHFADHCAVCHANNGSGDTEMGKNLYPKAPDMREPATQSLTDGEIYFIIHNGIRMSGMPAWGNESDGDHDHDSWMLVSFIRHLPRITPEELRDMAKFNPQSPAEMQEQKEEEDFLNGKPEKK